MRYGKLYFFALCAAVLSIVASCGSHKKLSDLKKGEAPVVQLHMGKEETFVPQLDSSSLDKPKTITVVEDDGTEIIYIVVGKTEPFKISKRITR